MREGVDTSVHSEDFGMVWQNLQEGKNGWESSSNVANIGPNGFHKILLCV